VRPSLQVISAGVLASIQDFGRIGFRRFGVPQSGVLHPGLARIANALAGNPENSAVIEFFLVGPSFRVETGPVRIAFAGEFVVELLRGGARRVLRPWRSVTLNAGDVVQLGPVTAGKAGYIAVTGGFDIEPVLGSCATYLRGGFGGFEGRRLLPEALIPLQGAADIGTDLQLMRPPALETFGGVAAGSDAATPLVLRVILGPQEDYFTTEAIDVFLGGTYVVSRESDRMGSRLEGPLLTHRAGMKPEIISDGIVPGSIQVPGNGAPIVLLADAQTAGGYPKIATVISSDLPSFAVLPPGRKVRFQSVDPATAERLLRTQSEELGAVIASAEPIGRGRQINLQELCRANLVSGVVDANAADDWL
jgi:allophanate hydrolase